MLISIPLKLLPPRRDCPPKPDRRARLMHVISTMLDPYHGMIALRLENDSEYTLGRAGKHSVACIAGLRTFSEGY